MKYKFHYTYRIMNIVLHKYYYGSRSTNTEPMKELGFSYFSSSTDKTFKKDQKENPSHYKYKVILIFDSRKKATQLEIKLHQKFDVKVHESFYNKSNQTSDGFDTTGMKMSEEFRKKCRERTFSKETREKISNANKGRPCTEETKRKVSKAHKGRISPTKGMKYSKEQKKFWSDIKKGENNPFYGKQHSEKTLNDTVVCPHCDKEGVRMGMGRWHFDNCKFKMGR